MRSSESQSFSDDFSVDSSQLICLNLLNTKQNYETIT